MRPVVYVSTVGTSLLTNRAGALTDLLRRTANQQETALDPESRAAIGERIEAVRSILQSGDLQAVRNQSAELNGLIALGGHLSPADQHYLLHTDTFQGREAAGLVREWLAARSCTVFPVCLQGMHVGSAAAFDAGVECLLHFAHGTLAPLRAAGHRVVFNLVGGFKAVQAYCQTLGMFHADEITYLFEGSSELIRIPRLPIRVDTELFRPHAALLERLHEATDLPLAELRGVPETLLETHGDRATFSSWGLLCWGEAREEWVNRELLEHPGLSYNDSFRRDFAHSRMSALRAGLQSALARAAVRWQEGGLHALRADTRLQYENYRGRNDGVGHFKFAEGPRVSCLPQGGTLLLRHCGPHDYVNDNP